MPKKEGRLLVKPFTVIPEFIMTSIASLYVQLGSVVAVFNPFTQNQGDEPKDFLTSLQETLKSRQVQDIPSCSTLTVSHSVPPVTMQLQLSTGSSDATLVEQVSTPKQQRRDMLLVKQMDPLRRIPSAPILEGYFVK